MRVWRTSLSVKLFLAIMSGMLTVIVLLVGASYISVGQSFLRYLGEIELTRVQPIAATFEIEYRQRGNWDGIPRDPSGFFNWINARMRPFGGPPGSPPGVMPPQPPPPPGSFQGNRQGYSQGNRQGAPPGFGSPPPPRDQTGSDGGVYPWDWQDRGPPPGANRGPDRLGLNARVALLDAQGKFIAGATAGASSNLRLPLKSADDRIVGYLSLASANLMAPDLDDRFRADQFERFFWISAAAVIVAALIAWVVTVQLRRPINQLLGATRQLGAGKFDTRIEVRGGDELAELARSFNQLAEALDRHEQSRRKWVADTSHELRTPLAVLRAQIEAMQDGVRPTDGRNLAVLQSEVRALTQLVDDLYTLARTDVGQLDYRFVPVNPVELIEDVTEGFAPRFAGAGITLTVAQASGEHPTLIGDSTRLRQLLVNLLENTLRYTDTGGQAEIGCYVIDNTVMIRLDDSAPGVPDQALSRLFDRFYRVEGSRSRASGGSGLGLAICQGIVAAHHGEIVASASPLGGLRVDIHLPRAPKGAST